LVDLQIDALNFIENEKYFRKKKLWLISKLMH